MILRRVLAGALLVTGLLVAPGAPAQAATSSDNRAGQRDTFVNAPVTVTNGTQFSDTAGNPVHAHGGGILKDGAHYYWFGENRNADNTFRAVSVYRSTDLRTWEFRANVLTPAAAGELQGANIERPKVIYNATTRRYVMWMHKENGRDYSEARAAVASSATIDGAYTYHGSFRPLGVHMSRDITLYNDGGTAYMISAADENYDLHIYRLTPDYLTVASLVGNFWDGAHREAPAMFKRGSTYFLLTSGATGWSPNQAKYATAPSISGPWSGWTNVGDGTTFRSQPTYVLPVGNSFLYLGDRWAGAWNGPVNDSQYVWLPITFPSATSMSLSWYPTITIDVAAGTVSGNPVVYHRITNRNSGRVLDVINSSVADNAEIKQWGWNGGANQRWELRDVGGGYVAIVNQNSGKCLDVANASTADGANVIQYTCGSGANQQWQWQSSDGYFRIVARHSGKCLDVINAGTTDGTDVGHHTCNAGANQQWTRTSS